MLYAFHWLCYQERFAYELQYHWCVPTGGISATTTCGDYACRSRLVWSLFVLSNTIINTIERGNPAFSFAGRV